MADLMSLGKRGGKEIAQESAKTDGCCKGGSTGVGGGDASIFAGLKRGGKEIAVEVAPRNFGGK